MSAAVVSAGKPSSEDTQLRGPWLALARTVWATVAALIVAFFLANLPVYVVQLRTTCRRQPCAPWQLTAARAQAIQQIHLSLATYAVLSLALSVACVLVWFAVAAVIVWRQSRRWLGLLISLLLLVNGVNQMGGGMLAPLEYGTTLDNTLAWFAGALSIALYLLGFSLFPNGRFVPHWLRWAIVVLIPGIFGVCWFLFASSGSTENSFNPLGLGIALAVLLVPMLAQVYRYRRVSTPVERQQTKWVVLGVIEGVLLGPLYFSLPIFVPALSGPDSLFYLVFRPIFIALWMLAPISFGIALLRYHLWDVDVIIRRTLIYGSLTGILAAIYFGCVIAAQAIAQTLTGVRSLPPVAVVASTLLIAALFTPLRHRIQLVIDRRFYRRKYDAAKAVAAFSAALRNEVDLNQLRADLLAVVKETMQPAHVSLWLSSSPPPRGQPPTADVPGETSELNVHARS